MEIRGYDSYEEMQADMARAEAQANAGLMPEQIALRDDTEVDRYWFRPYPEMGMLIFGVAWGFKSACEVSAKYVPDIPQPDSRLDEYEESLDEAVYEIRSMVESRKRGYLRGWAYSMVEPEGEPGSTHVANTMPISREAFEEARAHGWRAVALDHLMQALYDAGSEEFRRELGEKWTPTLIHELEVIGHLMSERYGKE